MTAPLVFQPSRPFTLGVELEFQLLEQERLDLTPAGPAILAKVGEAYRQRIKAEFIQSMVEICTGVCPDMNTVASELTDLGRKVEELAKEENALIYAASLHPFGLVRERHVSSGVRYSEIMDDLQLAGRRLITQALHIHVGLSDGETAIRVCDTIRPYLPILLALTTSSPFFEGEDSGFYSYRTNLFKTLPRSGFPETLGTWRHFQELIAILNEATLLKNIKELWWDVRPHPDFGTVEIRICDLPSRLSDILGMVALTQALVITLSKGGFPVPPFREVMLNNKWHASRYGLDGTFISPQRGKHISFRDAAGQLLDMIRPAATDHGGAPYLEGVERILAEGTSAHFQRKLYAKHQNFRAVLAEMQKGFWQ